MMSHARVPQIALATLHKRLGGLASQWTCSALHMDIRHAHPRNNNCKHFHLLAQHQAQRYPLKKYENTEEEKRLLLKSSALLESAAEKAKNKESFIQAIDKYLEKESVYRRGHVEFMEAAMAKMKEFGVHNDLDCYKKMLQLFPEGKMIPKSVWQVELMHFPKQQQTAIFLMDQMEYQGVIPDEDFGCRLAAIFGTKAHAFRKYRRMMYWLPKFKNINPYPVPQAIPEDPLMMAVIALKRMAVDLENRISVWRIGEEKEFDSETDETFIASAMSPKQEELINSHPVDEPVYVEGGFTTWIRNKCLTYFILRSATPVITQKDEKEKDLFNWTLFFEDENRTDLVPKPSVHEQEDGTVLGMCITGTGSKDSLVAWIRYLQLHNPKLEKIPIVFTLRSPETRVQVPDETKENKSVIAGNKT
ncbi:hypothetical protein ACJMK2_035532 [Sinanodonta woodiana]|uniref:Evolutionarily conserved signaling intermediate in Toll pathway, mitochondrial n=1 Tax=Sinanodonta woodiana TaxID=1069815 RepID=A0ABD3WZ62_SINWO